MAGKRMVAATAAWYHAWANQQDVRAVTLSQLAEYEALS
jgi:hypothetical protein